MGDFVSEFAYIDQCINNTFRGTWGLGSDQYGAGF
jgi:hypothetical protein